MADERWMTVPEVADVLRVHPETIREWLRSGRLEGVRIGRRSGWRISETQLNAFLGRDESKIAA